MKTIKDSLLDKEYDLLRQRVFDILDQLPHSSTDKPYMRLKNGRRVYFNIFLRKYGLI